MRVHGSSFLPLVYSLLAAASSVRLCGLGQDAVGSEGHLLRGGAGYRLTRVAGNHDHEIGVSGVARLREDDAGVGKGGSVVADLVRDPRPFGERLGQAVFEGSVR